MSDRYKIDCPNCLASLDLSKIKLTQEDWEICWICSNCGSEFELVEKSEGSDDDSKRVNPEGEGTSGASERKGGAGRTD